MTSPIELKQIVKKQIMGAVHQAKTLDRSKLIAELCLDTGLTEKTIGKIIDQLESLGYIAVENGIIKLVPPKPSAEASQ